MPRAVGVIGTGAMGMGVVRSLLGHRGRTFARDIRPEAPALAATFKIVNNLLAATNLAAGAEALALATRAGVDPRAALDVINASSGASWVVAERMARALAGDDEVRAATRILAKDVRIAVALADRVGADARFARAAQRAFADAIAAGLGDQDDAAPLKPCLQRAGARGTPEHRRSLFARGRGRR